MNRRGFSLLEILLALAILGGSLAVLSQIVGIGGDSASSARDLAFCRLLCQAKLAETLVSGLTPVAVPSTPIAAPDQSSDTPFFYTLELAPAPVQGMLALRVSVQAMTSDQSMPTATYSITRWIIDPALGLAQAQADADAAKQAEAAETEAAGDTNAPAPPSDGSTP